MGRFTHCRATFRDRLPDELVLQILHMRLWRPLDYGPGQAKERVQLEAVCRRFQALVRASGSLDWGLPDDAQSEVSKAAYISYMLAQSELASPLSRFAIHMDADDADDALMTFLRVVVPVSRRTLVEVRLFLVGDDKPCINWESVFSLLQACDKLSVIDICLFCCDTRAPSMSLECSAASKSFSSLQALTLYGIHVQNLASFIQSCPMLKTLEVHQKAGDKDTVSSSSLQKLYCWGNKSGRMDSAYPANVYVPGSLTMLLSIVRTGEWWRAGDSVAKLDYLLDDHVANQKALLKVPGAVQDVLNLFDTVVDFEYDVHIINVLLKLSCEPEVQKVIASRVRNLEALVTLLVDDELIDEEAEISGDIATILLRVLSSNVESRRTIASLPDSVRGLVGLAIKTWESRWDWHMAGNALEILASLALEPEVVKPCASHPDGLQKILKELAARSLPGLYEGVVELLDARREVQETALDALTSLANSSQDVKAISSVPGCIEKLASILWDASSEVQDRSARLLRSLAATEEIARAIARVPGCLVRLVQLLQSERAGMQGAAAQLVLASAAYVEDCSAAAVVPTMLQSLRWLLECSGKVQEAATAVLGRLSQNAQTRISIASTPGCLQRLNTLLESQNPAVRKHAVQVFHSVSQDWTSRQGVAHLPGAFRRLLGLLSYADHDAQTQCLAAGTLGRLAVDAEIAGALVRVPGCVRSLVELLEAQSEELQTAAVQSLETLTQHSESRQAVATLMPRLVSLASEGNQEAVRRAAGKVVRDFERNMRRGVAGLGGETLGEEKTVQERGSSNAGKSGS